MWLWQQQRWRWRQWLSEAAAGGGAAAAVGGGESQLICNTALCGPSLEVVFV
jgi:hypothetical protein